MAKNLEQSMTFVVGYSRLLRFIVSVIHVLTISACWLSALPTLYQGVLTILILWSWRINISPREISIVYLRYTHHHGWSLLSNSGEYQHIDIQASTVVTEFLIALHWVQSKGRCQSMIIPKDAMSGNDYRKLSVCLVVSGYGHG